MRRTGRRFTGIGVTIASLMVTASALAATVTGVTAKQRYPWNGMVDINCTVSGINGTTNGLEFSVATVNSGNVHDISQFWVVKDGTNSVDHTVHTNGTYHLVWNSKTDFDNQIYSNMVMRVNLTVIHDKVQLWENGPYWATTNIGAEEPYESGYYFWWGDTIGYKRVNDTWGASDGSSSNFSFTNTIPTSSKNVATLQSEGWITADGVLASAHDAAHVHWGGNWRMPTRQELDDLNNNCDWTWTTMNGVRGYAVRGRGTYANASIFLPAVGLGNGTSFLDSGRWGYYWASVPSDNNVLTAMNLVFYSGNRSTYSIYYRFVGHPVRPLQDQDIDTCTVTLDRQSGSGGPSSVTATFGAPMPTLADLPTRAGYTFGGYYTAVNGGGTEYYTAAGASARNWNIASNTTLYAKWTENSSVDTRDKVQLWDGGPYWATTNIGAEKPEDYGYYFWWGDTIGYERVNDAWVASDGSSSNFSFNSDNAPTYMKEMATLQSEEWITAEGVLAPVHDAAHVHWGGNWRMPTQQDMDGLNNNCDWTWTTMNGVSGYAVRGRGTYFNASIFLPAAGHAFTTSLDKSGSYGDYGSSVPYSDYAYNAWGLDFHSNYHRTYILSRYCGYSVRPLQDQDVNDTCTVTLDWQSGSGGPSSVTATLGAPMPTLADLPTRVGYTFGGYYTAVNGGGTEYYTAAGASARNWNIASNTTLYAKWTENSSVDTHDKVQLWEGGPYWATTNIGAEKPEDYGYYFWWGDTIGYERVNDAWVASDGSSLNFSFSADNTPTVGKDIAALRTEGWISADGVLAPEHDAAHVQWGGNWRMPTKQELEDLSNNCDWTWTTMNGVNGHIVRGRGGYASNSIFLPATGVGSATSLQNSGSHGIYLSSVPSDTNRALYLSFDSGTIYPDGCHYRRLGRAIRPLQGGTK